MAGSATSYLRTAVLGHTLGFAPFTMPASVYVGLATTLPSGTTAGTEVLGGGYARRAITFSMASGRSDLAANTVTIEWPPATANWGTIGWFELYDALSAGNRLYWGVLVDPIDLVTPISRAINSGDIMRLPASAVTCQAI